MTDDQLSPQEIAEANRTDEQRAQGQIPHRAVLADDGICPRCGLALDHTPPHEAGGPR